MVYARFFIHAINEKDQKNFLNNVKKIIKKKGFIFFEFRTTKDPLIKKGVKISKYERYDDHYRRFIQPNQFIKKLKEIGFKILYFKTSNKFAVYKNQKPNICRIISKKVH